MSALVRATTATDQIIMSPLVCSFFTLKRKEKLE